MLRAGRVLMLTRKALAQIACGSLLLTVVYGGPSQGAEPSTVVISGDGSGSSNVEPILALNGAAPLQAIRPIPGSTGWELLGSQEGSQWTLVGTFDLLYGDVPVGAQATDTSISEVQHSFVVGEITVPDTTMDTFQVVASLSEPGAHSLLPEGALLFRAYLVEEEVDKAISAATELAGVAEEIEETGVSAQESCTAVPTLSEVESAFSEEENDFEDLSTCSQCSLQRDQSYQACQQQHSMCVLNVQLSFTACMAGCATAPATCTICVALAVIGQQSCNNSFDSCVALADVRFELCMMNCGPSPI